MPTGTRGRPLSAPSRRSRRVAPALAVALLALGAAGACGDGGRRTVPSELHGTWRTEQEPYRKRYLEIHADRLVLGVAAREQLELETLEVLRVHRDAEPDGRSVFRLRYSAPQGYEDTMVLRYRAEPEPALRIAHRDGLWRREAP